MAVHASAKKQRSDLAIPPGETLRETLTAKGLSQKELAMRMGRPVKTVNEIVQGKAQIMPETAIQLERVLDVSARFWLNLESQYRETLARQDAERELERDADCVRDFPYAEMASWGWVPPARKSLDKACELLKFFSVSSFDRISEVEAPAFRIAKSWKVSQGALAAWLRQGEIEAQGSDIAPLNRDKLRASLPSIRRLTRDSKTFSARLREICAKCGVAVVFVPHLKGTHVNGAARLFSSPNRALVQLSLRYRYADIFWFTVFHEIGHVMLHLDKLRGVFVDFESMEGDAAEAEANAFAADTLIPRPAYDRFVDRGVFTSSAIREFAEAQEIAEGIVAGRLAKERILSWNQVSGLRPRLIFSSEGENQES